MKIKAYVKCHKGQHEKYQHSPLLAFPMPQYVLHTAGPNVLSPDFDLKQGC